MVYGHAFHQNNVSFVPATRIFPPQTMVTGPIQAAWHGSESPTLSSICHHLGLTWTKFLETYKGLGSPCHFDVKILAPFQENSAWKGLTKIHDVNGVHVFGLNS